ncbi:MAG: pyridoxamine 5'-phosphate oxidase family protein [Microgenomates group bacterium]
MDHVLNKTYLHQFLQQNLLGVLSTVTSDNIPDAAPIYFIPHASFEIYFITAASTQKVKNINHANDVVLTIMNKDLTETVRVCGKAEITDNDATKSLGELARSLQYKENFLEALPVLKYKGQKKLVVKIVPTEIRIRQYTEYSFVEKKFDFTSQ